MVSQQRNEMLAGLYTPAGRVSVVLSAGIQMVRKYRTRMWAGNARQYARSCQDNYYCVSLARVKYELINQPIPEVSRAPKTPSHMFLLHDEKVNMLASRDRERELAGSRLTGKLTEGLDLRASPSTSFLPGGK